MILIRTIFLTVSILLSTLLSASSYDYEIVDLGTAGQPVAINDNGEVAVNIGTASDRRVSGYIFDGSKLVAVGSRDKEFSSIIDIAGSGMLVGTISNGTSYHPALATEQGVDEINIPNAFAAMPHKINNFDQLVGTAFFKDDCCKHPLSNTFFYQNGHVEILNHPAFQQLEPVALNNSGSVLVNAITTHPRYKEASIVWQAGQFGRALPIAENHTTVDMNEQGQITGYIQLPSGKTKSFLLTKGKLELIDSFGGRESVPNAMNDLGEVVGWATNTEGYHIAYHYSHNTLTNLGTLGGKSSDAFDINVHGQIVGNAETAEGKIHAFTSKAGIMTDLNELLPFHSEWELLTATKVNNYGHIIGTGLYHGKLRNYLIRPATSWRRTIVLIHAESEPGEAVFIRGGIDHVFASENLGLKCTSRNMNCAIPIRHLNSLNKATSEWKKGDNYLDWYGPERKQQKQDKDPVAFGSPLDWTTAIWPEKWGKTKRYLSHGYGEFQHNEFGAYYWLLDVEMDCSRTYKGWFEFKSYIANGGGWESNITQENAPYESWNHFAKCGKINVFQRDSGASAGIFKDIPTTGLPDN